QTKIDAYFVYFTPETTFPANPRLGSLVTPAKKLHPLLDQNHFCRHLITYGLEESSPGHLHIGIPSRCLSPVSHVPVSKGSRLPDFPAKDKRTRQPARRRIAHALHARERWSRERAGLHFPAISTPKWSGRDTSEAGRERISLRAIGQTNTYVVRYKSKTITIDLSVQNYGSIRDTYDKSPGLRARVTFSGRRSLTHGDDDEEQHFRVYCPSLLSSASTRLSAV
ncbi:uncharacterized protein CCOS01_08876, partial [Colletotrichum costaricense]